MRKLGNALFHLPHLTGQLLPPRCCPRPWQVNIKMFALALMAQSLLLDQETYPVSLPA